MDDLHQLYEHQTMMAFGIYSLLDNLLSNIPPSSGISAQVDDEAVDYTFTTLNEENRQLRPIVNRLASSGIFQFHLGESLTDERENTGPLPRVAQESTDGSVITPAPPTVPQESRQSVEQGSENGVVECEEVKKINSAPGGYAENMFIYISDLEKEEFMCAICYGILKEAYQCTNGHKFCYGCIYTWSTGPDLGHDSCPVCRCDGLYAKNLEIVNRISRKKVRCLNTGCNWLGSLQDHEGHSHRRYTPHELDVILSSEKKSANSPAPRLRLRSNRISSQTIVSSPCVGSHTVSSHRSANSPTTEPDHHQILQRTSTNTPEGRMSATPMTRRAHTQWSGANRNLLDTPIPRDTRPECPTRMSDSAVTVCGYPSTDSLPALQRTERLGLRADHLTSPHPVITTQTPASVACLMTRNPLFSTDSPRVEEDDDLLSSTDSPPGHTNCLSLPEINRNARLTSQLASAPTYNSTCRSTTQEGSLGATEQFSSISPDLEALTQPRQQLEFRRLAPRRPGRVVEQLRETRERLAAMLQLMTLELEERRQHVINATLATAARTNRLMQTLAATHSIMQTETEDEQSVISNRDNDHFSSPQRRTVPNSIARDQVGMSRSLYLLRTLPVPERRTSHFPLPSRLDRLASGHRNESRPLADHYSDSSTHEVDINQLPAFSSQRPIDQRVANIYNPAWGGARLLSRGRQGCSEHQDPTRSPLPTLRLITNRRYPDRVAMSFAQPVMTNTITGWSSSSSSSSNSGESDDGET